MLDAIVFIPTAYSGAAMALDIAMALDEAAQARYFEIYGVAWAPLYDDSEAYLREIGRTTARTESEYGAGSCASATACTIAA